MDVPIFDSLAAYATPPNNYVGTTLFLSYIALALYATLSIIFSLYAQYQDVYHSSPPKNDASQPKGDSTAIAAAKAARARHIKIYAFLASISFATLSYHMLFFLITHYQTWSGNTSLATISGDKLIQWMLQSSLFKDFADELVSNAQNTMWTQLAILATWFWNIWMARTGKNHGQDLYTCSILITHSPRPPDPTLNNAHLHSPQPNPAHQLHDHSILDPSSSVESRYLF